MPLSGHSNHNLIYFIINEYCIQVKYMPTALAKNELLGYNDDVCFENLSGKGEIFCRNIRFI